MDENKEESKKPEEIKEEAIKKEEPKAEVKPEAKQKTSVESDSQKEKSKFEKVSKEELDKINKENAKEVKNENKAKKEKVKKSNNGKSKKLASKIIAIIVVVAIIILLTAMIAVSSDPKKSLESLLMNLKAGDFEKAQEYLSDDGSLTDTLLDDETQKLLFNKLSWNIKKVTKDKDKATIVVEIKNKDFKTIIKNYTDKALEDAKSSAKEAIQNGNSSASISIVDPTSQRDKLKQYFLDELNKDDVPTTSNEIVINAVKVDNKWKIVSDDNLVNALLPGFEDAVNSLL